MAISLYDLTVPSFLQVVGAVEGFLGKGLAHFKEKDVDPNSIVEYRLFDDMLPFRFQVLAVSMHSIGAIKGVKAGAFSPPGQLPQLDYAGLQKTVSEAREALEQLKPDEVNSCDGKDVLFSVRDIKMPFTAQGFLQSFSMPNFYFHATTAYDMLRLKGVPVGKRDFLGKMKLKT
jgi:uncharacterized protein